MDFGLALSAQLHAYPMAAATYRRPSQAWLGQTLPEGFREYLQPSAEVRGRWLDARLQSLVGVEGAEVIEIANGHGIQALLGYQPQPWDTQHFGISCAKLGPMCTPLVASRRDSEALMRALLDRAVERSRAAGTKVLQRRILASRFAEIGVLEDLGFHMVDNVVTLTAATSAITANGVACPIGIAFRLVRESDREVLAAMTTGAFPCSRFVTDRVLNSEKGRALYVVWLDRLIDAAVGDEPGRPEIIVACRGDVPVGYCAYRIDASIQADIGSTLAAIELIVVSSEERGAGLGVALLQAAGRKAGAAGADILESSTWSGQKAALAANQAAGLRVRETLLTYHHYL